MGPGHIVNVVNNHPTQLLQQVLLQQLLLQSADHDIDSDLLKQVVACHSDFCPALSSSARMLLSSKCTASMDGQPCVYAHAQYSAT